MFQKKLANAKRILELGKKKRNFLEEIAKNSKKGTRQQWQQHQILNENKNKNKKTKRCNRK